MSLTAISPPRGHAGVAELVDARHSKCRSHKECRFDSDRPHQMTGPARELAAVTSSNATSAGKTIALKEKMIGDDEKTFPHGNRPAR